MTPHARPRTRRFSITACVLALCLLLTGASMPATVRADQFSYEHPTGISVAYPADWSISKGNRHAPTLPDDLVTFCSEAHVHDVSLVVMNATEADLSDVAVNVEARTYGEPASREWMTGLPDGQVGLHTTTLLPDGSTLIRESRLLRLGDKTVWLFTQYSDEAEMAEQAAQRSAVLESMADSLSPSSSDQEPLAVDYVAIALPDAPDRLADGPRPSTASFVWPCDGYMGALYGDPVSYGSKGYHDGIDIISSNPWTTGRGRKVYAVYQGTVDAIYTDPLTSHEIGVRIHHATVGRWSHYWHMANEATGDSYIDCSYGQSVTSNTNIGYQGDHRYYSGGYWGDRFTHLHLTISTGSGMSSDVDPSSYLGRNLTYGSPGAVPYWTFISRDGGGGDDDDPPAKPSSVDATTDDPNKIRVTWSSSSGATHYDLYRMETSTGVNEGSWRRNSLSGNSYDDTTAESNRDYYYWVTACNDHGCSNDPSGDYGSPAHGRRTDTSPQYPVQFYINADYDDGYCYKPTAGRSDFLPNCSRYVDQVSSVLLQDGWSVQVFRDANWSGPSACLTANDRDLSNNTYDDGSNMNDSISSYELFHQESCPSPVTIPNAPANIAASDGNYSDKVRVTWSASSGATRYEVYRATTSSGSKTKLGESTGILYDDTSAIAGTTYYYWAKACNSAGCSGYSSWDTGGLGGDPPPPVTDFVALDGDSWAGDCVGILWQESPGATTYEIYRALSATGARVLIDTTPYEMVWCDDWAEPGTIYYYWMKACNAFGCSDFAGPDTGYWVEIPSPPTNVQASDGTHTDKVQITWDSAEWVDNYRVYRATSSTSTKTQLAVARSASYDDTSALPGTTYYYWLAACNSAGCSGYSSYDTGRRETPTPTYPLQLFKGANYTDGSCSRDETGKRRLASDCATYDDAVSSILLQEGWSVRVYNNDNWYGRSACLTSSDPDLSDNVYDDGTPMNNSISSYTLFYQDACPPLPETPTGLWATQGAYDNKVVLEWDSAANANLYYVWRFPAEGGPAIQLGNTHACRLEDESATPEERHRYVVIALGDGGWSYYSDPCVGYLSATTLTSPASFFPEPRFGGQSCDATTEGLWNLRDLCPAMDRQGSSILIKPGWSIRVYDGLDGEGLSYCLTESDYDLSDDYAATDVPLNDAIRSFKLFHDDACPDRPANDDWLNIPYSSRPVNIALDTTGATVELNEQEISPELGTGYNTVWYKFGGIGGEYIQVSTAGSDYDTVVAVYGRMRGNMYFVGYDDDSGPGTTSDLLAYLPSGDYSAQIGFDAYYLKVAAKSPGGGMLHLVVEDGPGDEHEPDDIIQMAKPITSGQPQTHSIAPVGDEDWTTFDLATESEVIIETSGSGQDDTRMWLLDSEGGQIEYDDDDGDGHYSRIDRLCDDNALPAGTYYVRVDEYGDNDEIDAYQILLSIEPCNPNVICTPPPCTPPGVLICPPGQDCPGGCGVICATPTATPDAYGYPTPGAPKTRRGWLPVITK